MNGATVALTTKQESDMGIKVDGSKAMPAFTCGHEASEPRNMGRGIARAKRLAAYFARPCLPCAEESTVQSARALTNHTPELEKRWLVKLRKQY